MALAANDRLPTGPVTFLFTDVEGSTAGRAQHAPGALAIP